MCDCFDQISVGFFNVRPHRFDITTRGKLLGMQLITAVDSGVDFFSKLGRICIVCAQLAKCLKNDGIDARNGLVWLRQIFQLLPNRPKFAPWLCI